MNGDLPEGWATITLGAIAERITKGSTPTSYGFKFLSKGIAFVKVENLKKGFIDRDSIHHFISEEANKNQERSILRAGDILFSIAGTIGATCIVRQEDLPANTNQALSIIRGTSSLFVPDFLLRQLESEVAKTQARAKERGGGMHNISLEDVKQMTVIVPPLREQKRIAARLETLFAKVDACQHRLAKIPTLLKRFRQSVLDAACSGRLTEDWREENSASAVADDLPNGWSWSPLQRFLPEGGIFDGPFGSNLKTSDYTGSGVRVIRLENIGQLSFFEEKQTFISQKKYESLKKHTVREGDIIFASFISEEVRACVLPKLSTKAIAKADCFCLRPDASQVDPKYLVLQLVSRQAYDRLFEEVHGATRPRINTTQLRKLPVRTCPLPEQQEIFCRVEKLFALADQIEARFAEAKKRVDSITQSILAKAFFGELVPTEYELATAEGRSFESAEELIKRIAEDGGPGKDGKRRSAEQ